MTAVLRSINPMKIARAINPVATGRAIIKGIKNTGDEVAVKGAIEAGKNFTYWFGGLIGIAVGILNPLLMYHQYKSKGVPAKERNALVVQEAANQGVNMVVHMTCYFGLSALVAGLLKKVPGINKDLIDITKIMVANIGGFLGQGVVRPILGSTILMKWQDKQKAKAAASGEGSQEQGAQENPQMQSAQPAAGQAPGPQPNEDQMIQQLLQSLQQQGPQQPPAQPSMPPQAPPVVAPPPAPAPQFNMPLPPSFPTQPPPVAPAPPAFPPFAPPPSLPPAMPTGFAPGFPGPAAPAPNPFIQQ